jgi:hypothetical protein
MRLDYAPRLNGVLPKVDSAKFNAFFETGPGILPRKRLIAAHGFHHFEDRRAGLPGVIPIYHHR